jgi:hypothetical protein
MTSSLLLFWAADTAGADAPHASAFAGIGAHDALSRTAQRRPVRELFLVWSVRGSGPLDHLILVFMGAPP